MKKTAKYSYPYMLKITESTTLLKKSGPEFNLDVGAVKYM